MLAVAAYLLGSIPSGLILTRATTGADVRACASGNIGAANVSRVAGMRTGVAVLILDMAKGFVPVILGRLLGLDPTELAIIAGIAVLGHIFSAFLRFKGGKGVATALGVMLALAPLPAAVACIVWLLALAVWKYSSLASLLALAAMPVLLALFDQPSAYIPLAFGLWLVALYTHRDNIQRLSSGRENRIGDQSVA